MSNNQIKQEIPDIIYDLAVQLEQQMVSLGGDPRDPTEVEAFVNGCGIAKKIKKIILEALDNE